MSAFEILGVAAFVSCFALTIFCSKLLKVFSRLESCQIELLADFANLESTMLEFARAKGWIPCPAPEEAADETT